MEYKWVTKYGKETLDEKALKDEIEKLVEEKNISNSQIVAFYTDEIVIDQFWRNDKRENLDSEMKKDLFSKERLHLLLEMRIFNEMKELKIWRSTIGREFYFRIADDEENSVNEENQWKVCNYLDTSKKKCKLEQNSKYNNAKVEIVHYIDYYEETGQASLEDWRIAKIEIVEREC